MCRTASRYHILVYVDRGTRLTHENTTKLQQRFVLLHRSIVNRCWSYTGRCSHPSCRNIVIRVPETGRDFDQAHRQHWTTGERPYGPQLSGARTIRQPGESLPLLPSWTRRSLEKRDFDFCATLDRLKCLNDYTSFRRLYVHGSAGRATAPQVSILHALVLTRTTGGTAAP